MTFRSRANEVAYSKYRQANPHKGCPFCAFSQNDGQTVSETSKFWVARNIFPYSIWEGLPVIEHLMITPKRHVDSLHHFTPAESKEYMTLLGDYDKLGYSVYTRASSNVSKSVAHQHTHLLKLGTKVAKVSLYLKRPYMLWYR